MQISFGKTAYVGSTSSDMVDAIEDYNGCNTVMTGDGQVMLDFKDLENLDLQKEDKLTKVEKYLLEAINKIREIEDAPIGDIVFSI